MLSCRKCKFQSFVCPLSPQTNPLIYSNASQWFTTFSRSHRITKSVSSCNRGMFSSVGVENALWKDFCLFRGNKHQNFTLLLLFLKYTLHNFCLVAHQFIQIIQFPSSLVLRNSTQLPAFQSCSKELRFKSLIVNETDMTAIFWFSVIYIAIWSWTMSLIKRFWCKFLLQMNFQNLIKLIPVSFYT